MNLFIKAPGSGRAAQASDVAEILFSNRKAKVPAEGFPLRMVQGIAVWADPILRGGGFRLRVHAYCPACNKPMAVGRLAQHSKIHSKGGF